MRFRFARTSGKHNDDAAKRCFFDPIVVSFCQLKGQTLTYTILYKRYVGHSPIHKEPQHFRTVVHLR